MSNELQRVRSTAAPFKTQCSPMAWHELLLSMNSTASSVLVRKEHLDEVCECHRRHATGNVYPKLVTEGTKYYTVDRQALFDFVQAHGKVCSHAV